MKEIITKILKNIDIKEDDFLLFNDQRKPIELKKDNFYDIQDSKSDKKIAFIDGGNLEVIKSPSLSLFFNRIYYTIYQNNKRIKNNIYEFYTLITTINKNDKLYFKTEYFFTKNKFSIESYEFDSFDSSLTSGNKRANISLIGNIIRRFAELIIANEIKSDFVIIDGSLEPTYCFEEELTNKLKNSVYGLSKTTELLTKNGSSISAYLTNSTTKKTWYYKVNDNLNFVKLHPKSKYIFRFESFSNINEVLSLLKENSIDPIFLGYPYGLIEADRFGRVSNKEKEILQLQLQIKFKKDYEKILPFLNSLNAHEILDSVG